MYPGNGLFKNKQVFLLENAEKKFSTHPNSIDMYVGYMWYAYVYVYIYVYVYMYVYAKDENKLTWTCK